jgi:hypothetical protein
VLVATTTTSTAKASIRFAAFLCEISGSYLTFPPHGQAELPWSTRGSAQHSNSNCSCWGLPDDYATTTPIDATKLRFVINNLASIVRNVHDCARAVRLIDQAYERATVFPCKPGHDC